MTAELIAEARSFIAEVEDHEPLYSLSREAGLLFALCRDLEAATAKLRAVLEFVNQPPEHQHVADYYRWTGNAQARQQLAAVLDVPAPSNCFANGVTE